MAEFNFADSYRAAGLKPAPEILKTRQEPFEKLRNVIDPATAIDLTRLYFGLLVPRGTDWFRDAFGATDTSFSLIDNAREAAVLAAGLLESATADGKIYAALATLTAAVSGLREPLVRPELVEAMRFAIQEKAINARKQVPIDPKHIRQPAASKLSNELAALAQGADINKAAVLLKQVSEESTEITKMLASQVFSVAAPLTAQVLTLREEVDMLWWHVGGWSRLLEKPFADLDLGLTAVMAGLDMADMSQSPMGPAAAPALLQRTLVAGRKTKAAKVAIKDAVDALPHNQLVRLKLTDKLRSVPEICPVLTAFAKAHEIGAGTSWHEAYSKATGIEPGQSMTPLELTMQAYRERLLLKALA